MAGGRLKSGTKNKNSKGKKWKKGQSCVTNPVKKEHREAAKSRFFNVIAGPSDLTQEALAKHDAAGGELDIDGDVEFSDAGSAAGRSVGGKTFNTWASNWTECTNATFSKVHRYGNSSSALHKEVLAVLAAVTEVIKSNGGKETETEYFAALMTALETVEGETSMAAILHLLSIGIKRVTQNVLRNRFSEVSKALLEILIQHADSDTPSLLRSTLMTLAQLLRVQEQAMWNNASTTHVYNALLQFTVHSKPKVRKAAQQAVRAILKGSVFMTSANPPPQHPATSTTAKYCIQQIEQCGGQGEVAITLHVLGLLAEILGSFPHNSLKATCETILRVMTLANVMVRAVSMKALHGMFLSQPKPSCLSAELNAQIITALYDYQPGVNDAQAMTAWLAVMETAHLNLARLNEGLCTSHLPRLFTTSMAAMRSEKREVAKAAAKTLTSLLTECVTPACDRLAADLKSAPRNANNTPAHKLFKPLEAGLSYQYHAVWDLVLELLNTAFKVMGKQCHSIMKKCLLSLADLRDSHRFPHTTELDRAVGMAVRTMGPPRVLEAIPLQITGENDDYNFPRSWLLPVLRSNVQDTELAFYTTYFLPLAAKLRAKTAEFAKAGRVVEAKTYDALQSQIWGLLPGFCTRPTDLMTSFKGIARILGSAIADREDVRMEVLASLRKLINHNIDNEENRAELSRFAKNFLPLFFNLMTADTENERDSTRLAVLETAKCYMKIADNEIVTTFFDKSLEKLSEEDISSLRRHALMDLTIIMVPHVDKKRLKKMYPLVISQLKSTDRTVQKKSYRVLEEMCSGKSASTKAFVASNLEDLQTGLLQSLSTSSASSKAPRLRCLIHIFLNLEQPQFEFMTAVVPEAILCTKENAERARVAAFALLVCMGRATLRWAGQGRDGDEEMADDATVKEDVVSKYVELLTAGLAGSPHMISCTVLALTKVLYEFRGLVSTPLLEMLINNACVLLTSRSREIVQSALGLSKLLLSCFTESSLAKYLQQLITSLVSMKEDNKHHFRFKAKELFAKLIRKFGFETIVSLVPDSHHRLLGNIRKTEERAKRQKKEGRTHDDDSDEEMAIKSRPETIEELLRDSDSDMEDDAAEKRKKKTAAAASKKKPGAAWLREGGEEDYVDFLDPSVSQKVLATKPADQNVKSAGVKHEFKTAPDGRLIISDDGDEQKKGGKRAAPADIDDIDELLDAMGGGGAKKRKRKLDEVVDTNDDEDGGAMKYKTGGSGIHRNLGGSGKSSPGSEYRAKKAGGDIKKTGKVEPYAYVPLQFTSLNKRKRAKAKGQFTNFVKGAKKGAAKGSKMRSKTKQ